VDTRIFSGSPETVSFIKRCRTMTAKQKGFVRTEFCVENTKHALKSRIVLCLCAYTNVCFSFRLFIIIIFHFSSVQGVSRWTDHRKPPTGEGDNNGLLSACPSFRGKKSPTQDSCCCTAKCTSACCCPPSIENMAFSPSKVTAYIISYYNNSYNRTKRGTTRTRENVYLDIFFFPNPGKDALTTSPISIYLRTMIGEPLQAEC